MDIHEVGMKRFIEEEVGKIKGKYVFVRAGIFERAMVRKISCQKLHPNPEDEFCRPEIGPNQEIISRYEKVFRESRYDPEVLRFRETDAGKPLEIQKILPDGYMILNGHHRWMAALWVGVSNLPVRIVNLMSEKDVRETLENSVHDMRITLDLEEVVFAADGNGRLEKPLRFPLNRIYRERLRLGIPALFTFCAAHGYDVWLYSSGYESADYIREMMKGYRTQITGIIMSTARRNPGNARELENIEKLMKARYSRTVHAGNDAVLRIDSRTKEYMEYPLSSGEWTAQVMDTMREMERNESISAT